MGRQLAAMVCLLGSWSWLSAQAVRQRILEINPNQTAVLKGSVSPRVAARYRIGSLAASKQIHGITMYFQPTAEQKAELAALVKAQQTLGSPEYHQWLTPAEYASRFGMSEADLQKVESWLESEGFNVDGVNHSRTAITFSGTAEQVETAFGTQMGEYRINGNVHWANATNLSIPAALAGVVQSVENLNTFRPRPEVRYHAESELTARGAFTSSQTGSHFMTPGDVSTIYDIRPAYGSGFNGAGETIAIMGQSAISASDIEAFEKAAGLPVKDPNMILVPNSGTSTVVTGDESESDLDVEYSGAIAKGATIDFVYVGGDTNKSVFDSLQYAVDNKLGSVISISYGACEETVSTSAFQTEELVMQQGATQGQSIIASSGDDGSTSCWGVTGSSTSPLTTTQQEALAVNYPASSQYVTGVGGTEFSAADVAKTNTTYWQSANGSDVVSSALSYIPETTWNDDVTCGQYATQNNTPTQALCSGGGGVSALASRPSWQTGVAGIPSGTMRVVPDVSLDSSPVNAPYLFCTSDQGAWQTGQQGSCTNGFRDSSSQGYLTAAGGTSFAAPIFAGMIAIINQATNSTGQGIAAEELYKLAASGTVYGSVFHDITTGGNQCTAGAAYCSSAGASQYAATTGYDPATGLGSVDFANLMAAWPASTSTLAPSVTTVTAASSTVTAGSSDTITVTVASNSSAVTTTPTGTVQILVDGTAQTPTLTLTNGTATYSYATTTSTLDGPHSIEAVYQGDSTFATSTGIVSVTVSGGAAPPAFTLSGSPTTISAKAGSSGTSTITVASQNSYAGTVDFTLAVTSSNYASLTNNGCYTINSATVSADTTATTTLTLYTSQSQCSSTTTGGMRPGMHAIEFRGGGGAAQNRSPFGGGVPVAAAGLGGLLLFGLRRRSKLWTMLGCLMMAVALGGFASGCGGHSGTGTGTGGGGTTTVAPGSYSLTLQGTDSVNTGITASTNLTLTVN